MDESADEQFAHWVEAVAATYPVQWAAHMDAMKAAVWDEGFADGKRQDFEGDDGPRFVNPYRRP
jgi:hypothetical protein